MSQLTRKILFLLFFLSGFCGLVYQVVWTRMAFAAFGIITPVLSVVLSVFMLGLAAGSWAGGCWIPALTKKTGRSAVFFYAGAELVIGAGAFVVPKSFAAGQQLLLASGETDSFRYLLFSALLLAGSILPWCACMGATYPFMMAYIRERNSSDGESFSYLYLANVLGAMSGTFLAAVVFIELLGFHHTLWVAAAGNFVIAFISAVLGFQQRPAPSVAEVVPSAATTAPTPAAGMQDTMIRWILFATGFIAMAMEVVWTRAFTPVLKTQVYSFAMIVFTYLGATFLGSWVYRRDVRLNRLKGRPFLMGWLAVMALLPVLLNSPKFLVADYEKAGIHFPSALLLLAGIIPFCALLGYLTPGLIDEYAGGNPARAGRAYAINVLGCILGPLLACYVLLPHLSERHSLILLELPCLVFCHQLRGGLSRRLGGVLAVFLVAALFWSAFGTEDFEGALKRQAGKAGSGIAIRRDYTATVISFGEGNGRRLLVNGMGMTALSPITKFIAHLPLAFHQGKPESVLVICFGMGTTYRSAISWNIDATVVELVPSVVDAFGFYHADAARFINATNGHVIIDDGRRFLKRTADKFDVIVVDPPPPVQAAGSSLLFSEEFYKLAGQHLKPGGILQMWFPGDNETATCQAVIRSIHDSFPYVRCFQSVSGWGVHMLGSMEPIERLDAGQLVARVPESARQDLLEWNNVKDATGYMARVVTNEYYVPQFLNPDLNVRVTDDRPFNEYYLLRELRK